MLRAPTGSPSVTPSPSCAAAQRCCARRGPRRLALLLASVLAPVWVLVLAPLAGCGGQSKGPVSALDAYRAALDRKDYGAAYDMMSASFRGRHSRDEFIRMMKQSPKEVGETVSQLGRPSKSIEITAELRYGLGDRLRLVREGDEWRIATSPLQFYSQATPRDALRSFLRAYRLKRWDIMLRFVPDRYRERMDADKLRQQFEGEQREDMDFMMRTLEANVDEPITDKGNEARMSYGERFEVKFVREDGQWKIRDID